MSEQVGYDSVGALFSPPDVDGARAFFAEKSRAMTNKMMTVREAVERFVPAGAYLASGGFGTVRIASAALHEIVRQRKRGLGFAGHTTTHDFQILAAGQCFDRCDAAYGVGLEVRGLSPNARRVMESGEGQVTPLTRRRRLVCRWRAAWSCVPGLPKTRPSRQATWSLPMISASGWALTTARAFASDRRSAPASGASPGNSASSTAGLAVANGKPRRARRSRRNGEVEARISGGMVIGGLAAVDLARRGRGTGAEGQG